MNGVKKLKFDSLLHANTDGRGRRLKGSGWKGEDVPIPDILDQLSMAEFGWPSPSGAEYGKRAAGHGRRR